MIPFARQVGCVSLMALASLAGPVANGQEDGNALVTVAASSAVEAFLPGETFLLAFRFEIAPHWHIYWVNPGDSGTATAIEIKTPPGFDVGEIIWPRPQRISGDSVTYGYEGEATLFVPVTAPNNLPADPVTFTAAIEWLVCRESCLLGSAATNVVVEAANSPTRPPSGEQAAQPDYRFDNRALADRFAECPRPLDDLEGAVITRSGDEWTIRGPANGARSIEFFPNPTPGVELTEVACEVDGGLFRLVVRVRVSEANTRGITPMLRGVIGLGKDRRDPSWTAEIPLTEEKKTPIGGNDGVPPCP